MDGLVFHVKIISLFITSVLSRGLKMPYKMIKCGIRGMYEWPEARSDIWFWTKAPRGQQGNECLTAYETNGRSILLHLKTPQKSAGINSISCYGQLVGSKWNIMWNTRTHARTHARRTQVGFEIPAHAHLDTIFSPRSCIIDDCRAEVFLLLIQTYWCDMPIMWPFDLHILPRDLEH